MSISAAYLNQFYQGAQEPYDTAGGGPLPDDTMTDWSDSAVRAALEMVVGSMLNPCPPESGIFGIPGPEIPLKYHDSPLFLI